jgi:hypothetical protein
MESKDILGSYRYIPNFINEAEEAYLLRKVGQSAITGTTYEKADLIRRRSPKVLNRNGGT